MKMQRMLALMAEEFRANSPCRCESCVVVLASLKAMSMHGVGSDEQQREAMLIVGTALCLAAQTSMDDAEKAQMINRGAVFAELMIRGALAHETVKDN
jgi:hypothetical protein